MLPAPTRDNENSKQHEREESKSEQDAVICLARLQFGSGSDEFLTVDGEGGASLAAVEAFEQAAKKKPQQWKPVHLKV
jgi:hypothetical protein